MKRFMELQGSLVLLISYKMVGRQRRKKNAICCIVAPVQTWPPDDKLWRVQTTFLIFKGGNYLWKHDWSNSIIWTMAKAMH